MQYLTKLNDSSDATFYAIQGDYASRVERYVVSTAETRAITNQPELAGCEYTRRLRTAVAKALAAAPFRPLIEALPQHRVCVLNFLRGGLNFGVRGALNEALGLNCHTSAFMSSQRSRTEDGRWQVREDMYRKLRIPAGAFVLAGDVVATGITVENGLDVLVHHLKAIGSSIRWLAFFTIGCHKLEKVLNRFDDRLREAFDDYERSFAIYFEGKFKLVDSRTELHIGIPGTDLIRRESLLAPEFEASQWERVSYPLERCTIYDAGSRAFDVPSYAEDVLEYWSKVRQLARDGLSLRRALQERWPQSEYASYEAFVKAKRAQWRGVDEARLAQIYAGYEGRWPDRPTAADLDSPEALEIIARQRSMRLQEALR